MLDQYCAEFMTQMAVWTEAALDRALLPTERALLGRWPSPDLAAVTGLQVVRSAEPLGPGDVFRTRVEIRRDETVVASQLFTLRIAAESR